MNYSEVKKVLKERFEILLLSNGFRSVASSQGCDFIQARENSKVRIGYGVRDFVDEFETSCYIKIEINSIQKVESEIFEGSAFETLSLGMNSYMEVVNYNFRIKNEENINEWIQIVSKFYYEFAEPFFEKYQIVGDIDKLLNTNPGQRVPELNNLGQHVIKGLISAKLNQNPRYEDLKEFYQSEVEEKFKGHFMYEKCMSVIKFLDDHTLDELKEIAYSTK